jgi:hypothetical protein
LSLQRHFRARAIAKRQAIARLVDRMARVAADRIVAIGFCTDDHFRDAGFSARNIKDHGNLARHRAVQDAAKARASVGDADGPRR